MDRKWTYLEKLDCIVDLHYLLIRKRGGPNRNVTYIFIHTTALDTQKNESSSSIKSWRHVSTTLSCVCFSFIYHGDVTYMQQHIDLVSLYTCTCICFAFQRWTYLACTIWYTKISFYNTWLFFASEKTWIKLHANVYQILTSHPEYM